MIKLEALPHREAIEYFRSKGFAPESQRFHHLDVWREEHARNWVVAKAMRDDVSQLLRGEVGRALTEGRTLAQFQTELAPRLEEMGWWGRQAMKDPVTGEMVNAQLGSMRRLKVIFDTNMRTAHAAGHWAAIQRTKKAFPYLQYIQIDRPTKRHDHARFHDQIWRVDDPIWQRIYPPNGWFCGCTVLQRTEGWMKRHSRTVSPSPDLEEEAWTNKRTGEVFQVPRGVNPGFDTNPGAAWLNIRDAWAAVTPDLEGRPQRAFELGCIEGLRLQRLGRGVEGMVVLDAETEPVLVKHAAPEEAAIVRFLLADLPARGSILHSHITDAGLSSHDLVTLFDTGAASITAVSPGGAIWRAVRNPEAMHRPAMAEFYNRLPLFADELSTLPDGLMIYQHALALFLEKRRVITYHHYQTERVRQLLERFSDLVRRLIDGEP